MYVMVLHASEEVRQERSLWDRELLEGQTYGRIGGLGMDGLGMYD